MLPKAEMPPHRKIVIVVDDDDDLCAALRFSLQIEGYTVRTYARAADLLAEAAIPTSSGCLVVDYKMPDMNGLDLIARLRAQGNSLPAILITGSPAQAVRTRARLAGVPIVEKPLFGDALIETIRTSVSEAAAPQAK